MRRGLVHNPVELIQKRITKHYIVTRSTTSLDTTPTGRITNLPVTTREVSLESSKPRSSLFAQKFNSGRVTGISVIDPGNARVDIPRLTHVLAKIIFLVKV